MPHFKILSLLLLLISAVPLSVRAYDSDFYTSESRLASGRWVKISVDTTGIYQLSYETLRQWGFETPEKVTVHGYGAVQGADNTFGVYPDDLPAQHTLHTSDGRLLFYAEGPVSATVASVASNPPKIIRNYYSDSSYYFLTDQYTPASTPELEFVPNSANSTDEALFFDFREKEECNYGKGGAIFHSHNIEKGTPDVYHFRVRNLSRGNVNVRADGIIQHLNPTSLVLKFEGQTGTVSAMPSGIQPVVSNNRMWSAFNCSATLSPGDDEPLRDARMTMTLNCPENFRGSLIALDYVYFIYNRTQRMEPDQPLLFSQLRTQTIRNRNLIYSNAPSALEVWDVTVPWDVRPFATRHTGDRLSITLPYRPNEPTRLVAFDADHAYPEPSFAGKVANQNLHGLPVPEMVIITTELFRKAADELGAIHRERGIEVVVLNQSDIFNEFGSGAPSAAAIRRLNKMWHDRDSSHKFRFITLYGAATWDPRHLTGPQPDYPLTYLAEQSSHVQESAANFSNDAYFGMLSDASATSTIYRLNADVTVGRIPARSQLDALDYNSKVRAYLALPPAPEVYLRALTTSCDGDAFAHFDHNTILTDTLLHSNGLMSARRADELLFPVKKTGGEWDASRAIADSFKHGVGLFTYCGHGNPLALGNNLWTLNANKNHTNERFPLAMFATCEVAPIDRSMGIAEKMLLNPHGGIIGGIGACRSVYLERNKVLSYAVAQAYATAKPGTTMGEVFTLARRLLLNGEMSAQLGTNTMCYNYIGDPSIPMHIPEGKIVVETIFGQPATGEEMVAPGLICEFTGHVENPDGSLMSDFNGDLTFDLYRAPMVSPTRWQDNTMRYPMLDDVILTTCHGRIVNGRFSIPVPIPVSQAVWLAGRSILTAVDSTTGKPVAGFLRGPGIGSEYIEAPDAPAAPSIDRLAIGDSFLNADGTVLPAFDLEVCIHAPAGLPEGHAKFMSRAGLRLDGKRLGSDPTERAIADADGYYTLTVPVTVSRHGAHGLSLSVTDRLGRSASANIDFTVAPSNEPATLSIDTPEGFVRTTATFNAEAAESTPKGRLIITDSYGNTVLSHPDVSFPFEWNMRDSAGKPVPDGNYTATLLSPTHTANRLRFTIIK